MELLLGHDLIDVKVDKRETNLVKTKMEDVKMTTTSRAILPGFNGDSKDGTLQMWLYEIQALVGEKRSEADIKHAIRRSVKGEAATFLSTTEVDLTVGEIVKKMNAAFGPTSTGLSILSKFYALRQGDEETSGRFAIRLRATLHQAIIMGRVKTEERDELLKEAFYQGLRIKLKSACSYLNLKATDFDEFVSSVKLKEEELGLRSKVCKISVEESEVVKLRAQVAQLNTEVKRLGEATKQTTPTPQPLNPYARPYSEHNPQYYQGPYEEFPREREFGRGRGFVGGRGGDRGQGRGGGSGQGRGRGRGDPWVCYRCGQNGHIGKGCKAYLN